MCPDRKRLSWAGAGAGLKEIGVKGLGCAAGAGAGAKRKRKSCVPTEKNELPDGQQQQAISIYFFLEGLGFGV